ncbi:MAG: phospholipase D-like domain-containing protein [Nannocystaceae bacterium]
MHPADRWHLPARGPYPRRPGNQVIPWIDGIPFYERLAAAIRGARARVWAIVSFLQPDFAFPDGTPWWALLGEAEARGVDVRVLFWRNPGFMSTAHVSLGDARERARFATWGATWAGRWDSSGGDPAHCHHQKAYVVDALTDDPIAFVGGMVLSHATLARRGHHRGLEKHDAFVELRGPAVVDAEHNFVQRWNLGREDAEAPPWPDRRRAGPLPWPIRVPARRGDVDVQLARTLRPGLYDGAEVPAAPGAAPWAGGAGETTILEHYRGAIAAATRTLYLENQHPGQAALLEALAAALDRGVEVVMVVPGVPMAAIGRARAECEALARRGRADEHRYGPTFRALAALGERPGFTLVALARSDADPAGGLTHREIYCHAKVCVADGEWLTIGSANLVDLSLDADHTELNAAAWGAATALPLLRSLCGEHCDQALDEVDDLTALRRLAESARRSRASLDAGGPLLAGCYAVDPARYALDPPPTLGPTRRR